MYIITKKQEKSNKDFENYKKTFTASSLLEQLIYNLPPKIRGGNEKIVYSKKKHKTKMALMSYNFIHYNSKNKITISFLDFDYIDNINKIPFKMQYPTIEAFKYFLEAYELEDRINVIIETDKGYQCMIFWNNQILRNTKSFRKLQYIKTGFCNQIDFIDETPTMKTYGIMRNPLKHNHEIIDLEPRSLNDFEDFAYSDKLEEFKKIENKAIVPNAKKSLSKQEKQNVKMILSQVLKNEILTIPEGYRKSVFFQFAMLISKNKKLALNELYNIVMAKNKKYCVPEMEHTEIKDICKSVIKYNLQNKNFVSNPNKIEKKSKEEVMANRIENAKLTHEKRKKETEAKIKSAIVYLNEKGEKITAKRIAEYTKLNKNTLTKYTHLWKIKK